LFFFWSRIWFRAFLDGIHATLKPPAPITSWA
jgi:hypothetical protein